MSSPWKPSPEQVRSSAGKTVPDLVRPGLLVLFSGINPSLYSAAVGHHFARPGNRFWPALHAAGFTPRVLSPFEGELLLGLGYGITNVVDRATARADEVSTEEFMAGGRLLEEKIRRSSPNIIAFLGITAYRTAFRRPRASIGSQPEMIAGSVVWVLPNPSGLNAHYRLADLARSYRELKTASEHRTDQRQSPGGDEGQSAPPA